MRVVHISDIFSIITGEVLSKDGQFGVVNLITYMVSDRPVLMCELDSVMHVMQQRFTRLMPALLDLWCIGQDHHMTPHQFLSWFLQNRSAWYVVTPLPARVLASLNLKENGS